MRSFDYSKASGQVLADPETVRLLCDICALNGELSMLSVTERKMLSSIAHSVKFQDTASYCRVSGLGITETRQRALIHKRAVPKGSLEKMLLAYWNIIDKLPEFNGDTTPPRLTVEHLKSVDLLSVTANQSVDGKKKRQFVSESMPELLSLVGFYYRIGNSERDNGEMVGKMLDSFNNAAGNRATLPLLLIPCFVMDYSYVQNRLRGLRQDDHLLLNFLLTRYGFVAGRYCSLETAFENNHNEEKTAFEKSVRGWGSGNCDYKPFVLFVLRTLLDSYSDLLAKLKPAIGTTSSRSDRILKVIEESEDGVSKKAIVAKLPDMSVKTIERHLNALIEQNDNQCVVKKPGLGRDPVFYYMQNNTCPRKGKKRQKPSEDSGKKKTE